MGSLCIEGLPPSLVHLNEVGSGDIVDFVKTLSDCWRGATAGERAQLIRSLRNLRVKNPARWDRTAWDALGAVCRTLDGRELLVNSSSQVGFGEALGAFRLLRIASSVQSFDVSARLLRAANGEVLMPSQIFNRRLQSGLRIRVASEEEQWLALGSLQAWLSFCETRRQLPPKFDASEVPSMAIPGARVSQPVFWYTDTMYALAHVPWIYEPPSAHRRKRRCAGIRTQWPEAKADPCITIGTLPTDTFQRAAEVYPPYREDANGLSCPVPPDLPTREGGLIKFPGDHIRWDLLEAIARAWAFLKESQKGDPVAVRYRCQSTYAKKIETVHGGMVYRRGWLMGSIGGWGIVRSGSLACEHEWEVLPFEDEFDHADCLMEVKYSVIHLSELHPTAAMLSTRFEALRWAQYSLGEKVLVSTGGNGVLLYGNIVAVGEAMSSSRINAATPAGTVRVRIGFEREVVVGEDSCERFICFGSQPGVEGCFLGAPAPSGDLMLPRCMVRSTSLWNNSTSEGGVADVIPAGRYLGLIPLSVAPSVRRWQRERESESESEAEWGSGGHEAEEVSVPLRRSVRISAKKASQRICVLSKSLDEATPESERGSMSRPFPLVEDMGDNLQDEGAWEASPLKRRKLQHDISPVQPPKLPQVRDLQLKTQLHQALSFLAALGLDLVGSSAGGGRVYQFAAPLPNVTSPTPAPVAPQIKSTGSDIYSRHYERLQAQYPSQLGALPASAAPFLLGHKTRQLKPKHEKTVPGIRTRRQQLKSDAAGQNDTKASQGSLETLESLLQSTAVEGGKNVAPGPMVLSGAALETIFRAYCGQPLSSNTSATHQDACALTAMLSEITVAETPPHTELLAPETHVSLDPFPSYCFRRVPAAALSSTSTTDLASSILSSSSAAFPSSPPPRPSPRHCRHRAAAHESLSVLEVLDLQNRLKQLLEKVGPAAQRCAQVAQQLAPLVLNRSMEVAEYLSIVSRPVAIPCEPRRLTPGPPKRRWPPPEPVLAALRKPPRPVPIRPILSLRPQFPQPAMMKHP